MFSRLDYISIGTVGFAQVGNSTYEAKVKVEKSVINALYRKKKLEVPLEFVHTAKFRWKLCPHDFGSYWDFQILYNADIVDELEHEDLDKFNRFYDWVNECELALGKNQEFLEELMDRLYQKEITMEVVHRNFRIQENGLKAV